MNKPFFSCISTCYNEEDTLRVCIESILSQSFENFEFLLVDDGANQKTKSIIFEYNDARIKYIELSNSGLSTARNRAITLAQGEYLCFLDGDDMRPIWALEKAYEVAINKKPDCIFTKGKLVDLYKKTSCFYDNDVFDILYDEMKEENHFIDINNNRFEEIISFLPLIRPQSANKIIKRSFLDEYQLKFPDGLIFEDMLFHSGVISCLNSFSILNIPCFTYFRRYEHTQLTNSNSMNRLDAISVALITLEKFYETNSFKNVNLRVSLITSLFHHLEWNKSNISFQFKEYFDNAMKFLINTIAFEYFNKFYSEEFFLKINKIEWIYSVYPFMISYLEEDQIKDIDKRFILDFIKEVE